MTLTASQMGKKSARKRFKGMNKKQKSEHMKRVRAAAVDKRSSETCDRKTGDKNLTNVR